MIDAAAHYAERMAEFRGETVEPGGIVLLGSSHLEWFDTGKFLPEYRFVNRGIASDRLGLGERGIIHRLNESVYDCHPACILFDNGINDLGELARTGAPPMEAIEGMYERVVATIRERLPDVPMIISNCMPCSGRFAAISPLVPRFNDHIRAVATRYDCPLLDLDALVTDHAGNLRADLTYDGLHLEPAGYQIWADQLRSVLREILPVDH